MSCNNPFSIVTELWLDDRSSIPGRGRDFSLPHLIKTVFGAHPASYPVGTGNSFHGSNTSGAWGWPLTSI